MATVSFLLIIACVFASKTSKKLSTVPNLYYLNGFTDTPIYGCLLSIFTTSSFAAAYPAKIKEGTTVYSLFYYSTFTYFPVYNFKF